MVLNSCDFLSVTPSEYATIIASIESIYNKDFNCTSCVNRYSKRSDYGEMNSKMRTLKGCFTTKSPKSHKIEDVNFTTCVGNIARPDIGIRLLDIRKNMERGILPFVGGFMDQPSKIVEVMDIVDSLIIQRQNKELEDEKRRSKRR